MVIMRKVVVLVTMRISDVVMMMEQVVSKAEFITVLVCKSAKWLSLIIVNNV